MKMKRLAAMALTGVMTLSLATPAFAASKTVEIGGTYKDVVIDVVAPAKGTAVINPYGLDIKVKQDPTATAEDAPTTTISGQKIVTAPMALRNRTPMNLDVNATVLGVAQGDLRFAAAAIESTDTSKSAFVYLQATSSALTGTDEGDSATVTTAAIATEYAAWEASAYDEDKDIVVGEREASKDAIIRLKKATMAADEFSAYNAGSIALFRLAGDCVTSPRDAWTTKDGFTTNIVFTFTPVQVATYTITANAGTFNNPATAAATMAAAPNAAEGDEVTLTFTTAATADVLTVTVKTTDDTPVTVKTGTADIVYEEDGTTKTKGRTFTFTMPAGNVTVDMASA